MEIGELRHAQRAVLLIDVVDSGRLTGAAAEGDATCILRRGRGSGRDTGRALVLSLLDPHRYFYGSIAASANLNNRDYPRALELARQSIRANRMHRSIWRVLAVAQWQLGMQDKARQSVRQLLTLEPGFTIRGYLQRTPAATFSIGRLIADILAEAGVPN